MGELEPNAKRVQILRAAQTLFAEVGFEKTNVREIAARASVAPATIYAHFGSGKAAVLQAAFDDRMSSLLAELLTVEGTGPLAVFLNRARALNSALVADPLLRRVIKEQDQVSDPLLREHGLRLAEMLDAVGADELRRLVADGFATCTDPDAVIAMIRAVTHGWLVSDSAGISQPDHERVLSSLLMALEAWLAPADAG